jgi:hypothetical protein
MTNPSKAKGTAWESAVVNWLRSTAGFDARRKVQAGGLDQGDITVEETPWLVIEAKAAKAHDFAGWVGEANIEARNAGVSTGVVWAKRRGKSSPQDGYVVMDGATFRGLLSRFVALETALVDCETELSLRFDE